MPDTGQKLPKDFGGADLGFNGFFKAESGVDRGFTATIGSTGRRLFDNDNSRAVNLTYFSQWKLENGDSWHFFMTYSNNRTSFNGIPLPGLAYTVSRENYRLMLGFPFITANYNANPVSVNAFLSPFAAGLDAGYAIHGPLQTMTSIGWFPRSYQNIVPPEDRLIFEKKNGPPDCAWLTAPCPQPRLCMYTRSTGRSSVERRPWTATRTVWSASPTRAVFNCGSEHRSRTHFRVHFRVRKATRPSARH
ncbi:MAG: hypothetical protein HC902_09305 [Calothrix sp. SM1_5_4]|nr:hypothetical protein [Calothrix sp. SM1_5_4]